MTLGVAATITELAEQLVNAEGLVPGIAAAVVIALAFKLLQTVGRRVERIHRVQLYEIAGQSFGQDGLLTEREKEALQHMRVRLGYRPMTWRTWR